MAHGWAGGAAPSGAGIAFLGVLAVTLAAIAAAAPAAATVHGLTALLGAGQLLGHVALGVSGHTHSGAPPAVPMVSAHLAATVICAGLITAASRLCAALSRAVRAVATPGRSRPPAVAAAVVRSADQPLQSAVALAASTSHRGPPVVVR